MIRNFKRETIELYLAQSLDTTMSANYLYCQDLPILWEGMPSSRGQIRQTDKAYASVLQTRNEASTTKRKTIRDARDRW